MKVKGLIFDLDYTLYDMSQYTSGAHQLCVDHISMKLNISREEVDDALNEAIIKFGIQYDYLFNEWLKLLRNSDVELVKECIRIFHSYTPAKLDYYEGVVEVLNESKRKGYKIGVVTDGNYNTQCQKIELLSLDNYVDAIVLSDELNTSKPDKVVFDNICSKLGLSASDCIFIGDNPYNDIFGAQSAGMKTARLKKGPFANKPNVDDIVPDITLNEIESLLNYI